ncbi:hypothetical protein, partial [uncultured Desulfovibrio sp.]|uniref:hypothetical protein n=1 Tax=uncultured Desulfovibrio sp. TaxID=167968 RepID=UPI0026DC8131
ERRAQPEEPNAAPGRARESGGRAKRTSSPAPGFFCSGKRTEGRKRDSESFEESWPHGAIK